MRTHGLQAERTTGVRGIPLAVLALLLLGAAGVLLPSAHAQGNGFPAPAQQGISAPLPGIKRDNDESPLTKSIEERQVLARNDERQKRLVADTEKLLALATQLHEDVAKTNKNVLSIDVVRRSQEIEKLAHDIKERMKG